MVGAVLAGVLYFVSGYVWAKYFSEQYLKGFVFFILMVLAAGFFTAAMPLGTWFLLFCGTYFSGRIAGSIVRRRSEQDKDAGKPSA